MDIFNKFNEPFFLKANTSSEKQLDDLNSYLLKAPASAKEKIENDIRLITYGQIGEKAIEYELKNSHLPIYVIHDLYLVHEGNSAQIDYLIISKAGIYCIECKNLFGDIEVNSRGEFVRSYIINGYKRKEAIYSPITQNERHYELIKAMRLSDQNNPILKFLFNKMYENFNHLLVVIANPKSLLNVKYAKKEIKDKIIRADQLVQKLKSDIANSRSELLLTYKAMEDYAKYFIDHNKANKQDYTKKYESISIKEESTVPVANIETSPIYKELKSYRLNRSKADNIKPYFIYNDAQMRDIISKKPITKSALLTISGFAESKWQKYGEDICNICKKYK